MHPEHQRAVLRGFNAFRAECRTDPQKLETIWISMIAFAGDAWQLFPLTELFSLPELLMLPVDSRDHEHRLGAALLLLNRLIDREVEAPTDSRKGDWPPIVTIITAGEPTDDWRPSAGSLSTRTTRLHLVRIGEEFDPRTLTEGVHEISGTWAIEHLHELLLGYWRLSD
jgi:uncharacterized protein YegL